MQALQESERRTERIVRAMVLPMVRADDPEQRAVLTEAMRQRISRDDLTSLTVWQGDGVVLWSSDAGRTGTVETVSPDMRDALSGITTSHFETVGDDPEEGAGTVRNGPDSPDVGRRYAEVYAAVPAGGSGPIAAEAYYDYESIDATTRTLQVAFLPVVLAPLVLLQLVLVPLLLRLSRTLRQREHTRAEVLREALALTDREQARFAADLHDGPIQELAGISYVLGAASRGSSDPGRAHLVARAEQTLQDSVRSLRLLMTDLYPPDLDHATLAETIERLAAPLRHAGVDVRVEVEPDLPLGVDDALALCRITREALTNVSKHAAASAVTISVRRDGGAGDDVVRLVVTDDGVGLSTQDLAARRSSGHLGMRLLTDRVESRGGRVSVESVAGQGTTIRVDFPVVAAGS